MMTTGCVQGVVVKISWKYELLADSTILCALINCPSQASVTSTKRSSRKRRSNTSNKFDWKLFQRKQNACVAGDIDAAVVVVGDAVVVVVVVADADDDDGIFRVDLIGGLSRSYAVSDIFSFQQPASRSSAKLSSDLFSGVFARKSVKSKEKNYNK